MSHYPIYHAKRPCRKCGYTERLKSTGKCWTCEWNAAERYMKWFFANRDQIGRRHKWSAAQRRLHDRSMNVWTLFPVDLRNRESAKGRQGGRRGAAGRYTRFDIEAIRKSQDGQCAYCEETENLHRDHIVPIARGGTNWPWNLQLLCAFHNTSKNVTPDSEYRLLLGLPPANPLNHPFKAMLISALCVLV